MVFGMILNAQEKKGGISIAFDDGYPSWITIAAPELKKVGGVATVFVNNQRVHSGYLTFDDLKKLQNFYKWEIETHTYHHFNSAKYTEKYGVEKWLKEEVEKSISEFQANGIKPIHSIVFPFNSFNEKTAKIAFEKFDSFRRYSPLPLTNKLYNDKSYPGTSIDLGYYIPLRQVKMWINFARMQDKIMFVYSHEIFEENHYIKGEIASVGDDYIIAKNDFKPLNYNALCLVPDINTRIQNTDLKVKGFDGKKILIDNNNLKSVAKPGSSFIVGPCYGMQKSYFEELINYAAKKVKFYTVSEAVEKLKKN
jgi:peptidoglycan/xylan/chitin deacetylase (PgdA/CDA1 family)